jgi:phospholipid/cholesterol/gamma-HCH transport system substrate-binding protein
MENRSHAIAAGLFVVALTAGLLLAGLWLTRDHLDRVRYLVVSKLPVTGLHARSSVQLRGVEVGKVARIGFDPADPRTVLVEIDVDRAAALTRGTYGQLNLQGVTGLSYVELDDDGSDAHPLQTSSEAPGRIELRRSLIDQIGRMSQSLLVDASAAAQRLKLMLDDRNLANFAGALQNLETAGGRVAALAGGLQPAAQALPGLEKRADAALARLDGLLGDLRQTTGDLDRRLSALDDIGNGAREVGAASRALRATLVDDTLPRLTGAIDDLSRASRGLDRVLEEVEVQPQSLLLGRKLPPGPGESGFAAPTGSR